MLLIIAYMAVLSIVISNIFAAIGGITGET